MGYNIEISFNIYKSSNVSELKFNLIEIAEKNHCSPFIENTNIDYEMDNGLKLCEKRNHCVMTFNFDKSNILYFIKFLKTIKNLKPFNIETIYDDDTKIIYASRFYRTIMNKNCQINSFNSHDNLILLNMKK